MRNNWRRAEAGCGFRRMRPPRGLGRSAPAYTRGEGILTQPRGPLPWKFSAPAYYNGIAENSAVRRFEESRVARETKAGFFANSLAGYFSVSGNRSGDRDPENATSFRSLSRAARLSRSGGARCRLCIAPVVNHDPHHPRTAL